MHHNWRRNIRNATQLPSSYRPTTPPLLRSINKKARNLKQQRFYQNSQVDWIKYYNTLIDEYHKIEQEINGLDLNIDAENNLHLEIKQYRQQYMQWMQSMSNTLSESYVDDSMTYESLQEMKHTLNYNKEQLNSEQQIVEKELKQLKKSLNLLHTDKLSMRKENLIYYEFCLENDIISTDNCGGWSHKNHHKFVTVCGQYKKESFNMFYDRIKLHFPDTTKNKMIIHYKWYKLYLQHIATNKRMKIEKRAKHKLLIKQKKSNQLIKNSLNRLCLKEQNEKEIFDAKLTRLHDNMNEIQQIRNDQILQETLLQQKENEEKKMEELEQTMKWNQYRDEQKLKLNVYYQDEISRLEIKEFQAKQQQQLQQIKQKEINKVNRKRVDYRKHKLNQKVEEKKQLQLQKDKDIEMKELQLLKLRMNVQKQLNCDNIDNLCGILNPTESTLHRVTNDNKEGIINMFPNHGYSDKQLFEDPKFELMNHLIKNNLHKNAYAKKCLKNAETAVKSRKDCKHSNIF